MRAGIYVRVSTEDQVRHGYSLAEQREACWDRAVSMGASEITVFADEGISGSLLERPGLTALRDAVRNKRVDVIVVRDPDRLSRKLSHQLLLTDEFEGAGVRLEFLDFDWKETPEGRLFYSIRGAIAEYEREKIRDRMVRGKNQKARQGGIPVGFYAYGYDYDTGTGSAAVNGDEAAVVRLIFTWFTSEDIGMNGIAKRLNEAGIPTRKGRGKWHRNVVRQILSNSAYRGKWKYREFYIPVPALVDEETWNKARQKLKEARRLWAGLSKNNYLLSGIISCSDCGNTMTGVCVKWWNKKERRYTCRKNSQGARNKGCFPFKALPAEAMEKIVWEQVCSWLDDPEELAREAANGRWSEHMLSHELEAVKKKLSGVDKGREALLNVMASGFLDLDDDVKEKLVGLKRRRERLEKRKREIEEMLNGTRWYAAAGPEELIPPAREVLSGLDALNFQEKKALVRALISQVVVSGRSRQGRNGLKDVQVSIYARLTEKEDSSYTFDASTW